MTKLFSLQFAFSCFLDSLNCHGEYVSLHHATKSKNLNPKGLGSCHNPPQHEHTILCGQTGCVTNERHWEDNNCMSHMDTCEIPPESTTVIGIDCCGLTKWLISQKASEFLLDQPHRGEDMKKNCGTLPLAPRSQKRMFPVMLQPSLLDRCHSLAAVKAAWNIASQSAHSQLIKWCWFETEHFWQCATLKIFRHVCVTYFKIASMS